MLECDRCRRPIALNRPTCLYCGAPVESRPAAEPPGEAAQTADRERQLVGFWLGNGAKADDLASALGIERYEARLRMQRAGAQLWRTLERSEALAEAGRLRQAGLHTWRLEERTVLEVSQARAVKGGSFEGGRLRLRTARGAREYEPAEFLMVVRGPIARQYQWDPSRGGRLRESKQAPGALDPGYRFHLHVREPAPPLELDPGSFEFEHLEQGRAAYLTLNGWVRELSAHLPIDEGFRHEAPALGAAQPETNPVASWLPESGSRDRRGKSEIRVQLDNLAQFRFFSAWRALAERQRGRGPT